MEQVNELQIFFFFKERPELVGNIYILKINSTYRPNFLTKSAYVYQSYTVM